MHKWMYHPEVLPLGKVQRRGLPWINSRSYTLRQGCLEKAWSPSLGTLVNTLVNAQTAFEIDYLSVGLGDNYDSQHLTANITRRHEQKKAPASKWISLSRCTAMATMICKLCYLLNGLYDGTHWHQEVSERVSSGTSLKVTVFQIYNKKNHKYIYII